MLRLGVVSFLNSRPLIAGLESDADIQLVLDVPAALPGRLDRGEVDVSLIPVLDVLRGHGQYQVVSDACIACDGETMTVRIFAQVPPDRIRTLWVDTDVCESVSARSGRIRSGGSCEKIRTVIVSPSQPMQASDTTRYWP